MAAPSWAIVGTRLSDADALTGWDAGNISGDDTPVQGSSAIGQKISASVAGMGYTHGSQFDLSGTDRRCMYLWMSCASGIDTLANGGLRLRIGNDDANYLEYFVAGSDVYTGGWRKFVVSPRVTADAQAGSPGLTTIDYFAGFFDVVVSIMGNFNNALVDALDLLEAIRVTDGDATTPATFGRFQTFDTGTLANQYGLIRSQSGVFFMQGRLYIGDGATTTLFDDRSGAVVVFEDAPVDSDFYEIRLTASATLQLGELVAGAALNGATMLSSGPAWHLNLAAGTATLYGCTFGQLRIATLTSAVTARQCTFVEGGTITADGADLRGSAVINPTVAADDSVIGWDVATDPDGLLDDMLIQKGAAAHHAIAFGTSSPTSITLRGIDFTGFNASNGENDSTFHVLRTSGTVTINLVDCVGNFSFKTAGATVDIVTGTVTLRVTVKDEAGDPVQDAQTAIYALETAGGVTEGDELLSGSGGVDTDANGVAENTGFVYSGDVNVEVRSRKSSAADTPKYKHLRSPQVITSTGLQVTVTLIADPVNN